MKTSSLYRLLLAAPLPTASLALAQGLPPAPFPPLTLDPPKPQPVNRFSLSYRPGFNIYATFKGLGGYGSASPGSAAAGSNPGHFYDDGYNLQDTTAGDGLTWNWGYVHPANQIAGNMLLLSRSTAATPLESTSHEPQPQHGLELAYQRQLLTARRVHLGLETAFSFTDVTIRDSKTMSGSVTKTTDAYDLGDIVPPGSNPPPTPPAWAYRGTFSGPGALIGDTPTPWSTTVTPNGALIPGRRELDASLYVFRLGPYLELPLADQASFFISGGLAIAVVNSQFRFDERTTIPGGGTAFLSGSSHDSDVVFGGFVGGSFSYNLSRTVDLFVGLQYQVLQEYTHRSGERSVELDLGKTLFGVFGLGYSF